MNSYIKLTKITTGFVYNVTNLLNVTIQENSQSANINCGGGRSEMSALQYWRLFDELSSLFNIKNNVSSHYEIEIYFQSRAGKVYHWKNKYTGSTGCVQLGPDLNDQANENEHKIFDNNLRKLLSYFNLPR